MSFLYFVFINYLFCVPVFSAGVGRTGTFIVIDAMIEMMYAEPKIDVFGFVSRIRDQRSQLVQTDVSTAFGKNIMILADS